MCDSCSCPGVRGKTDYGRTDGQEARLLFTPVSITQLFIGSVSAVANSSSTLHRLRCCVLVNAAHLLATTALGDRKSKEDRGDTQVY